MVSWPRFAVRTVTVHETNVVTLLLNPTIRTKCSPSHEIQHRNPPYSSGPILTTAENRDTVAIEPKSKYRNGRRPVALADSIARAAYFPPWIAPWAIPGTPGT